MKKRLGRLLCFALVVSAMAFMLPASTYAIDDVYLLEIIDASGSMTTIRSSTGNTRFEDAKTRAIDFINSTNINPSSIRLNVSVWTFKNQNYYMHTNGYVDVSAAIKTIQGLGGPSGSTPLAMTLWEGHDDVKNVMPGLGRGIIHLNSDGLENSTPKTHPAYGPNSSSTTAPFDAGSWQNKIYTKFTPPVVIYVDVFTNYITNLKSTMAVREMASNRTTASVRASDRWAFFKAIAEKTGGTVSVINDNKPLPVAGDINGDFCVNDKDTNIILKYYDRPVTTPESALADLNKDGFISYDDYMIVLNNWGKGSGC